MARNGSGSYSNPYPNFVSGTVISSTQVDANNSDIATALTQSIAVDGQSTVTANLPMNAKKFTGLAVGAAATDSLTLGQAQAEAMVWCGTAGGSANAITLSPTPAITAYAAGQRFVWKASGSVNTGATTVAISGLGTIALQDNGSALAAGQHQANKIFMGILDTTSTVQVTQVQISGTDPLIVTSLTVSGTATVGGILSVDDTTTSTSGTTGSIHTDGGLGVAGTAFVAGAATVGGASQFNSTVTVGVNDTGYDVKLFGATSGKSLLWDESADSLIVTGTTTLVGTTNLDAVDIDGATQIDAAVTVGVNDTGYDVQFFGATSGAHMLWDESADDLKLVGAAGLTVAGNSVLASVDVTGLATAATFEPDGDTAAGDNAAIGYTAAEGLILTGQGSTNDVTIKNDADADVITIATGGTNVAIVGDLTANNFAGRNKIIGGDFTTNPWQRGTSFAAVASGVYFADRWIDYHSTTAVVTASKAADAPTAAQSGTFAQDCLSLAVTTADTSVASSDHFIFRQSIEGLNAASFGFGQAGSRNVTLSFWVKGTKTGIHCVSFINGAENRSYVAEYTIASTNTWEYQTITIPVDTAGTWLYTNGIGLRVSFTLVCGSNYQTSADTWTAGNYISTSNQVNAVDSTSNTFKIALVQLEAGSVATTFDARSVGDELALCQRYYFRETAADVFAGFAMSTVEAATYSTGMVRGLPVTMRAAPTCNTASTRLFDGTAAANVTSLGANRSSKTTWGVALVGSSGGLTVGRAVSLQASGTVAAYIDASAEL